MKRFMYNKKVYLTIDDCPSEDFNNKIGFLINHKIPALIFIVGNKIKHNPINLHSLRTQGFVIGNHSFSHDHFSQLSIEQCFEEITMTENFIYNSIDEPSNTFAKLFRFPYGDRGLIYYSEIQEFLKLNNYRNPFRDIIKYNLYHKNGFKDGYDIFWTLDSRDTIYNNLESIIKEIENFNLETGGSLLDRSSADILLTHDVNGNRLFYDLIEYLISMGIEFQSIR